MPDIFISYRRDDSSGHAGRLFDVMRGRFGDESVFMDVTDIQPGVDFTEALDRALSSCGVVLVLIGTQWLIATDASGRRRIDDPGDHLRREIAGALAREAHVIPVLLRGARMPAEHDLSEDIRPLALRQAQEVSDSRWAFDTDQLIRSVENALGLVRREDGRTSIGPPTTVVARDRRPFRHPWVWVALPVAVVIAVLGLAVAQGWWGVSERADRVSPASVTEPDAEQRGVGDPPTRAGQPAGAVRGTQPARLPASAEVRAGFATFKVLGGLVSGDASGSRTIRFFVRITNIGARTGFGLNPDSFRLVIEGQATPPKEAPSGVLTIQDTKDDWVVFEVPPNAEAVALQVGDVRQASAKIPIDLRAARTGVTDGPAPTWRYPADLAMTLEKQVGRIVFRVDSARLEHFADAVPPLQPERLLLSFKVHIRNVGAQSGYAVSGDDFRLLADGVPLAPMKSPSGVVDFQSSQAGDVLFLIPGTTMNAILQLGSLDWDPARVPVDLSLAR